MTYPALRRTYGPDVALIGGIDAEAVSRGEAQARAAVEETVPHLLGTGRYLPCLDDRPRRTMPFAMYVFYRRMLEAIAR